MTMSGFSLGGGGGRDRPEGGGGGGIPPENLFLYAGGAGGSDRIQDIPPAGYSRGFELWQQHQIYPSSGLLRFSDEPASGSSSGRSMRGSAGSSGSGMNCQDCGNQAKKDCVHLRCRTCCKSRGFQCPTHVKSTWVPASKRRERHQQLSVAAAGASLHHQRAGPSAGDAAAGEPSKRPREARVTTAIATTSGSGGGMQAVSFPPEVSSPAVFRCVRVSPIDEAEDEYAYQAAVCIGGHVFKGILYDQGPEGQYQGDHQPSSSSAPAADIAAAASAAATTSTAANIDPASTMYPTPLSAFMAGTQFFPHHPRP